MAEPTDDIQLADELLERFLHFEAIGLKEEATQTVLAIVDTLSSLEAMNAWTRNNLHRLPINKASRIRHELYERIIFPALKADFERGDPEASYLLGEHIQNLYSSHTLMEEIGQRSSRDFFRIAFQRDPSSVRYQRAYLGALISDLQFAFHEWPNGIIIDHKDWREGLSGVRDLLSLALSLDSDRAYYSLLSEWIENTDQYEKRLTGQNDRP